MRILSVGSRYPPWSLGGYEVVWASAVEALRDRGHAVRVLTTLPDPSDLTPLDEPSDEVFRELHWYWRDHEFPPHTFTQTLALERANASVLERHLLDLDPQAVLWWAMGGMSLSLIERVRRAQIPALGLVGDEWMVYGPAVDGWTARWRRWPRAARAVVGTVTGLPAWPELDTAAKWLFNSRYLLERARRAGWEMPRTEILPPGVDTERLGPREHTSWGWRLLYCGRLDPRKGIATAVEALARLPEQAVLAVVGDGNVSHREELAELAGKLGVGSRVSFRRVDHAQIGREYAEADVLVFPVCWREPWGLVPLEAMAAGLPVVASRAGGGPAEYLEDERNCLQFEPGDSGALASAVARLAAGQTLRTTLIDGGCRTASRYTAEAYFDGLQRELEALMAE